MIKRTFFLLIVLLIILPLSKASDIKNNAELIFPVLNIGVGARANAMGSAFTAIADDMTATYWNPAGLSLINNIQLGFSYNKWFMDSYIGNIVAAIKTGPGSIGLNIFYMNFGSFDKIDSPYSEMKDTINPFSFAVALAYGIGLNKNFSLGLSGKFIMQSLSTISYTGYAGDIGLLYKTSLFSAGITAKNLGTGGSYSLPININLGLALNLINSTSNSLIISSDFDYVLNSTHEIKAGIEYDYEKVLYLRAGYKYNLSDNYLTELKGFSVGAGLTLGVLQINYAYIPYGELGTSHNIMLCLSFGDKTTKQPKEKIAQPLKTPIPSVQKPKKTKEELYDMLATGGTYENSGKLDLAEQKYKEILGYDETYADAWKRLGAVYFKKKMVKEAIECFETYLKLRPDDKPVKNWLEKHKEIKK
jgi:hypothetical protein